MQQFNQDQINQLIGRDVIDNEGAKIGKLGQVYTDDLDQPQFVTVHTGLLGTKESFVPWDSVRMDEQEDGSIRVPFTKNQVKDAPSIDANGELSLSEEQTLYSHYGRSKEYTERQAANTKSQTGGTGGLLRRYTVVEERSRK